MGKKNLESAKFASPKTLFLVNFGSKNFWVKKVWAKQNFGPKCFWVKKSLGQTKFLSKNFSSKIFSPKRLWYPINWLILPKAPVDPTTDPIWNS